jgi:hypothetical protein
MESASPPKPPAKDGQAEMLSVEEIEDFVLQLNEAVQQSETGEIPAEMAAKLHKYASQVRPMMDKMKHTENQAPLQPRQVYIWSRLHS